MSVARAEGLGADVLPETSVEEAFGLTFEERPMNPERKGNLKDTFKPSILMDLEAQRPMELSGIVGNVVCESSRLPHPSSTDVGLASIGAQTQSLYATPRPAPRSHPARPGRGRPCGARQRQPG